MWILDIDHPWERNSVERDKRDAKLHFFIFFLAFYYTITFLPYTAVICIQIWHTFWRAFKIIFCPYKSYGFVKNHNGGIHVIVEYLSLAQFI